MNIVNKFACQLIFLWVAPCLLLLGASAAEAQNVVRGGISLEHAYDSNIYREPEGSETREWTTAVSPMIEYARLGRRSDLLLRYEPGVVYSYLTDDTRLDHFASGEYGHQLTRNLQVGLSDTFVRAEDPYEETAEVEDGIDISDRRGRRRYWINDASVRAEYTYGRESAAEAGYTYTVLQNNEDDIVGVDISDYTRHASFMSIRQRISTQWDVEMGYEYINGDFDEETEDFSEHAGDFYLYYNATRFTNVFGHYGHIWRDYDITREDYSVSIAAAGLEHQSSPTFLVEAEIGGSLVNRENFENTEAVFLRAGVDKSWQRSTWTLEAESGLDAQDFVGEGALGLSRYWLVSTGITRTLLRNITGSLNASYRDDTYLEREPEVKEQIMRAEVELVWSFARWYELSGRYVFVENNSDIEADNYTDHRFYVTLSAEKELMQW